MLSQMTMMGGIRLVSPPTSWYSSWIARATGERGMLHAQHSGRLFYLHIMSARPALRGAVKCRIIGRETGAPAGQEAATAAAPLPTGTLAWILPVAAAITNSFVAFARAR